VNSEESREEYLRARFPAILQIHSGQLRLGESRQKIKQLSSHFCRQMPFLVAIEKPAGSAFPVGIGRRNGQRGIHYAAFGHRSPDPTEISALGGGFELGGVPLLRGEPSRRE
jgi:hypothetical protein